MKRALLISVAAIALAAGGQAALSQGGGSKGPAGGAGASGGATINANPSGGGASGAATGGGSTGATGGASTSGAAANDTPSAEQPAGKSAPANRTGQKDQKDHPGAKQQGQAAPAPTGRPQQQGQAEHEKGSRQGANERNEGGKPGANESTTKQGASESTTTTRQGANERPMTSKNVSLTTEQKTTIREKVLTSSAPRVTTINFDIKIGTVVPRTVRVAPLPPTLITIEPEWRGFMYFVYNDEIIVVNPRTLEIVAVLEV